MLIDKDLFWKEGFVLVKGVFTDDEVRYYRDLLVKHSKLTDESFYDKRNWTEVDGVSKHIEFWPLIYNKNLLEAVRNILPTAPRYLQYSDLHVHYGSVGWHRDIRWDNGAGGNGKIGALRVAMYFQSFEESNFKMGVMP